MILLVVSAVSGTGKSTLIRELRARHPKLQLSVSHTTRAPREGEVDGVHYHFVTRERFEAMIEADEFVEHEAYAGNLYGTARSTIEAARARGEDLAFDIEVVGAGNIERAYPDAITCFILPPTWAEVEGRLRARGTETEASIARRLARGRDEMEAARGFQYLVENDDLQVAVDHLDAIYRAAGLRRSAGEGRLDALLREAR